MIENFKVSAMILLLTAAVLSISNSPAASAAEATADQASTEESADKDADKDADEQPSNKSANNSEVFIPTEEISEDFAVSFPVDI